MLEEINTAFESLPKSGTLSVLVLAAIALSQVLRWVPSFPNKLIPLAVVAVTTIGYPLLGDASTFPPTQHCPRCMMFLIGFFLGFVTWSVHTAVLSVILKKLQSLLPPGFVPDDAVKPKEDPKP